MKTMTQGTKEWLEWRKQRVTASEIPIIMGESPYMTMQQLWEEKINPTVENKTNYILELGHKFEDIARAQFELLAGYDFTPETVEHSELPFGASLDGINWEHSQLLEIKMVGKDDLQYVLDFKRPLDKHYGQLQFQMMLTGLKNANYFCYTLDKAKEKIENTAHIIVDYDPSYIENMMPKVLRFWNCVKTKVNPVQGDLTVAQKYVETKQQIEKLTEELDTLKTVLLTMSNEPKYTIGNVRISRSWRKGNVDYKKIPEIQGIDLDQYRGPDSETVRIDIV